MRISTVIMAAVVLNVIIVVIMFISSGFIGGGFGLTAWRDMEETLENAQKNNIALKRALKKEVRLLKEELAVARSELKSSSSSGKDRSLEKNEKKGKDDNLWLVVGMPTMAREKENYLARTITSIEEQLPAKGSPYYGKVKIVVMNVRPDIPHPQFESVKESLKSNIHFVFISKPADSDTAEEKEDAKMTDTGNANQPGAKVRQQTRDISTLLRMIAAGAAGTATTKFDYYMFAEDDFVFCPHFWRVSEYILSKAEAYVPRFTGIRVSYGLNGLFLHGGDIKELSSFFRQHQSRRPPDHLAVEWVARETEAGREYFSDGEGKDKGKRRINLAFKYNILAHIGTVSTLRSDISPSYPQCYEELLNPVNFEVEAFNPAQCPADDLWPCNTDGAGAVRLRSKALAGGYGKWPLIDWASLQERRE